MRASGGASPPPSAFTTTTLLVPSSSTVAMPPPRLAHLRRSSLLLLHHHRGGGGGSAPPLPLGRHPLLRPPPPPFQLLTPRFAMASVAQPGVAAGSAEYEEVLGCISSLITQKVRADTGNRGNQWELMAKYLQILELEEPIARLKVVHVAGTKGKGSTCTFAESILRSCGFRTGLFTSPHLMDVRERFRLNGLDISEEKFIRYFWWCWNKLKDRTGGDIPMPAYFRFLALLAFKIFSDEQVDVAVLEVGLGGKYDATNVVKAPVVCGISSLGYDHMEILGNTLGEIAGEKAGILKKGVPAYTVPQPEEAMSVLKHRASELGVPLQVVQPLDPQQLDDQPLGLHGEHQYMNAGLAVALVNTWLQKQGHFNILHKKHSVTLPDQFIKGLSSACLLGRAQIVPDPEVLSKDSSSLIFYLDGAHSPESMEICARWFSCVTRKDEKQPGSLDQPHIGTYSRKILLFNCMSVRDPQRLLPCLLVTCAQNGFQFDHALFVPNQSQYNKLGSHASPPSERVQIDLSWQLSLQRVWEGLLHSNKGLNGSKSSTASSVFESLPLAIKWLRETAQQNQSTSYQDKCNACDKTVHFIDLLTADSIPYHKSCFRCSHCKGTLSMCSYSSMDGVLYCKTHFEQLFKETGTFKKNFPSGAKANSEQPKIPSKLSSLFCGTQDKCTACKKTVYPLEKMTLEGEAYHRTCFKCAHGGCLLTNASYAAHNGILYCQNHFWQLFKKTGSYDNLLKPASAAENTVESEVAVAVAEPAKEEPEMEEVAKEEEASPEQVAEAVVEDQEHS
uniref:Folylpolyglutamate synthase n=1 Tax=Oryza punctata TaxID=4537 RepID=A0A0E0M9E7_ORYPU